MKNKYVITILGIALILVTISCGKKTTEIESDNFGVILDSLFYSTIQEAIDLADSCGTIYLTEGIYADDGDKNLTWDGDEKHLTITLADDAEYAIIECNGKGSGFVFKSTHQNTSDVVDGITIRNCSSFDDAGIYCEWTSPTIKNCTISGCDWCGIYCDNADPIIENCEILNNKEGIMANNESSPLIKLNIVRGNGLDGIFVTGDSYPSIINNLIIHNKRGIYCSYGRAYMVNNTIANNSVWGINYINDTPSNMINSIIWDNGKGFATSNINVLVKYSCAQDSFPSVNPDSLGNIYKNPLFVFSGEDYHLPRLSPCVDTGDSTAVTWGVDLDGNNRIAGETVDMGAYEW